MIRQIRSPAAALFSPWTDLAATGASMRSNARDVLFFGRLIEPWPQQYLNDREPKDPLASPLYAALSALPPLMIHVGEDEVLLDDSVWLAAHARAAGNDATLRIWPIVPHGWQLAPIIPEARQSVSEACDFLFSYIENRQTKHAHSK